MLFYKFLIFKIINLTIKTNAVTVFSIFFKKFRGGTDPTEPPLSANIDLDKFI